QEAKTQQEATVKAVPDQLPPTEDNKESSFDVLDDWDAPLPWETEETPVSSNEKVANDNEEDVLENFASLICQEKHKRTGGASFIEFANSLACRYGLKRPNGIEAYFSKHYPNVYEDFDIPF
ncbi:TPA: transcriptional regulator, partial [Escherichia coli]